MRCPSCREVESQVCNLHAMGDRDAVDVELDRLKAEVSRLIRERDEARQARRMAEEEVEQLRARIRGD